jgi:hypothetical protein
MAAMRLAGSDPSEVLLRMASRARRLLAVRRLALALAFTLRPALAVAQPDAATAPPALHWESAAYDTAQKRIVVFGGVASTGGYMSETWEWIGERWRTIADSAGGPGPRHAHAMTYDARRGGIVLFGGSIELRDSTLPAAERTRRLCDTWHLTMATWTRAADARCDIRQTAAAKLVTVGTRGDLLLVEGPPEGVPDSVRPRMRLWRRDGSAWALIDSSGPRIPGNASGGVAYDAERSVLVVPVLAGMDAGVWEWDERGWRHVRADGPPPRRQFAIAYDSRRRRVALIGGLAASPRRPLADHWTWDGRAWTEIARTGVQPTARSHATLLDDARHGRLLYFGGAGEEGLRRELWIFDRDGWHPWGAAPAR